MRCLQPGHATGPGRVRRENLSSRPGLGELQSVLEQDPLNNFSPLGTLARRQPAVVFVESLQPLQALLVFEPPRPQSPYQVWLWGFEAAVCRCLLSALSESTCYLTTPDEHAARALKAWAARVGYEGSYARYGFSSETLYATSPGAFEVRQLTANDAPLLAGSRPSVSQALVRGLREPGRVFGAIQDGEWRGDAFCFPAYRDVWVIGSLYVPEEHRRRGIGKALVTACTDYVLRNGGRPTYEAHVDNLPSRRTVEALGYDVIGTYHELELVLPEAVGCVQAKDM